MLGEPVVVGLAAVLVWVAVLAALGTGAWWTARRLGEEPGASRRPAADRLFALIGCTVTLVGVGVAALDWAVTVLLDGTVAAAASLGLGAVLAAGLLLLGRRHPLPTLATASVAVVASGLLGVAVASGSHSAIEWETRSALFGIGSLLPGVVAVLGVRRPLPAGVVLTVAAVLGTVVAMTSLEEVASGDPPLPAAALVLLNPTFWGGLLLLLAAAVGHRQGTARTEGDERAGALPGARLDT